MIARDVLKAYRSRRFDDHRWMKELGSKDLRRELRKMRVVPDFKTEPWLHQLVCFYLGLYFPEFLFLLDMGTGKTWILLNLLQQLLREKRVKRGLIFVPRLINMDSWMTAAAEHSNLEPWLVSATDIDEKWDQLENPRGDFSIIDYAGMHLACSRKVKKGKRNQLIKDESKVEKLARRYDFIGLDESHKAANAESLWFSILRHITREAKACYAATGTLFGRDIEAVWSQFYLVDRGETFGSNLGCFRETFFSAKPDPFKGQRLVFNKDTMPLLNKMIGHRSLRYEDHEVHSLPPMVHRVRKCSLEGDQQEQYLRMLERMLNAPDDPKEREAYWVRLRQITAGYVIWEDELGKHQVELKTKAKLLELEAILDEAGDQKLVISYEYTPGGRIIAERLTKLGISFEWLYGGTKDPIGSVRRFKSDPRCRVFLMNSDAGGTGVDGLQHVARYLIFFESPSGPTGRQQTLKRVYRSGQTLRTYVYDLVIERTVDAGILESVQEGRDLYEAVISGRIPKGLLFSPA